MKFYQMNHGNREEYTIKYYHFKTYKDEEVEMKLFQSLNEFTHLL